MDEIRLIDLHERMRQHVLAHWPGAEDLLRQLAEEPAGSPTEREVEALLASVGRLPLTGAQARRRLFQRREALMQGADAALAAGMSAAEVKQSIAALNQLRAIHSEHGTARSWAAQFDGPAALLDGIRRALPALRGQERWRFLRSVGAPVVVPERRRQQCLERLGLLRSAADESSGDSWAEQHEISLTLASLVSESVAAIDLLLGAFSGGEPGLPEGAAVCLRVPECPRCPLQTLCEFYRHRGGDLPAPRPTMKSIPEADRPRESFATRGTEFLTDTELLAIVLRSGAVGGGTALDLAARLLAKFETLGGLARAGVGELCTVSGIGPAKAAEILAALELGRRSAAVPLDKGAQWTSSAEIHRAMAPKLATLEHEEFWLLLLDTRLRLIREVTVSRGDLTGATVHPREVFKQAIRESAAAVIAIHNHPSGDPSPSREDRQITEQLAAAGEIVGIRLLDHLIIAAEGYVSFADRGWL